MPLQLEILATFGGGFHLIYLRSINLKQFLYKFLTKNDLKQIVWMAMLKSRGKLSLSIITLIFSCKLDNYHLRFILEKRIKRAT